jgi:AcrR family transcriptional regulator
MTDAANTKRPYRSALRKEQAQRTQATILDAARRLLVEHGWARTTIAAIAAEAGVSTETVYSVFGNKRTVLERLVEHAVRGDAPGMPLLDQAEPRQVADATDQRQQLRLFAKGVCAILDRVASLVAAARAAAESEASLGDIYRVLHEGRRRNLAFVANALLRNGSLRDDMSPQAATDCIFRLASPELFLLMRNVEGRSLDDIAAWLEESLAALLLTPWPARAGRG